MKILYVITSLGIGGAEKIATNIAVNAQSKERQYSVVSLTMPKLNRRKVLQDAGIEVIDLQVHNYSTALKAVFKLAKIIRKKKPDVVHGWLYHGCLFALLATMLSLRHTKTRLLWSIRSSKIKLEYHNLALWLTIKICGLLSFIPDHTIYNSYGGQDDHFISGFNIKQSSVIPNGVNSDVFKPDEKLRLQKRREIGLSDNDFVFGSIGRFHPMKGHQIFLDAFSSIHGAKAVIAGEGTQQLPKVDGAIYLDIQTDIEQLINACDVIVSSSYYGEGSSNVVLESMACGTPVIVSNVGDGRRLIENTGIIVPPNDTDGLAMAMQSLCENSDKVKQYAEATHVRALGYYDENVMMRTFTTTEDGTYDTGL